MSRSTAPSNTNGSTNDQSGPAPTSSESILGRRGLLRGAALAGAAAGVAVVGAAGSARTAHAADGDGLTIGADNEGTEATSLTIGGDNGSAAPALVLNNNNGPSLQLQPLSSQWEGQLDVGEIAGTDLGPIVGVDTAEGQVTTYLVTGVDLVDVPTPFPSAPTRVLDLRTAAGRESIRRSSTPDALRADGKLAAGQWIDVALVLTSGDYNVEAVFANLLVLSPVRGGWAVVYPSGPRPLTSTMNFAAGQAIANGVFVGTSTVLGYHCVRIYTNTDAHFVLDVTGGIARGNAPVPGAQAAAKSARSRSSLVKRVAKAVGRLSR